MPSNGAIVPSKKTATFAPSALSGSTFDDPLPRVARGPATRQK